MDELDRIIYFSDGTIDWNSNGWPEPNDLYDPQYDGYDTAGMPNEIFEIWEDECEKLDIGWSADY